MAALPIYLDETRRVKSPPVIAVSWRKNWQDTWQDFAVDVELLDRGCAPQIDRCLMRQRYGYMARSGAAGYQIVFPYLSSINGSYVRVSITPDLLTVANDTARLALRYLTVGAVVYQLSDGKVYRFNGPVGGESSGGNWEEHEIGRTETWYGVITNLQRDAMGGDVLGEAGDLLIEALGMEVLMTRKQISSSVIEDDPGVSAKTIERGLPFNAHRGDRDRGTYQTANKAPTPGAGGIAVFAKTLTTADNWTASEIVKYLLFNHQPADVNGPWFELDTAQTVLDSFIPIAVETDGRTLYDVLNSVIDRKRGILWWVEPQWQDEALVFILRVETSEVTNVTLPSGVVLPRNDHYRSLAIDSVGDLQSYRENYDSLRRYSQVIVEGGRQGAVFTVSIADGTLEPDWDATQQLAYLAGASGAPGYNVLDRSEQMTLNDNVRTSDAMRHVFTRFRVPHDWNGQAGNGSGGEKYHVFPVIGSSGNAPSAILGNQFWLAGMRFHNVIPLKAQWDYADPSYVPVNHNKSGTVAEYRRPFAVVSIPDISGEDEWFYADAAGVATNADELRNGTQQRVSCNLRMHEEQLGITLNPNAVPHMLASPSIFDGSNPSISPSHIGRPPVNYQTMKATVYAQGDNRIQVKYPSEAITVSNQESVHVIRLGDRGRVDYVVPGTIVDVSGGELKRATVPMFARDDREAMVDLARQAWLWYGTTRIALDLLIGHVTNQFRLGDLIGEVRYGYRYMTTVQGIVIMFGSKAWARTGSTDRVVNSAVTRIAWNLQRGTTAVVTDYAAIDFESEAMGAA